MIEWCLQEHSVGAFCRSMRRRFHKGDSHCSVGRLFYCALFICTAFFCDFSILATDDNTCDTDHKEKARCNHQAANILKCHRKKNKMQSPVCKHLQVPQKEKQDTIAYQESSSKYGKYKLRMRLFIVDRNKASAYELTM